MLCSNVSSKADSKIKISAMSCRSARRSADFRLSTYNFVVYALIPYAVFRARGYSNEANPGVHVRRRHGRANPKD